jgi:hypothetical protein
VKEIAEVIGVSIVSATFLTWFAATVVVFIRPDSADAAKKRAGREERKAA